MEYFRQVQGFLALNQPQYHFPHILSSPATEEGNIALSRHLTDKRAASRYLLVAPECETTRHFRGERLPTSVNPLALHILIHITSKVTWSQRTERPRHWLRGCLTASTFGHPPKAAGRSRVRVLVLRFWASIRDQAGEQPIRRDSREAPLGQVG